MGRYIRGFLDTGLSVPAAAALLGVHPNTVYLWAKRPPKVVQEWRKLYIERERVRQELIETLKGIK